MTSDQERKPYNSLKEIPVFKSYGGFVVFNIVNNSWYNIQVTNHKVKRITLDRKHVESRIDRETSDQYGLNRLTKYLNPQTGKWSTDFGLVPTRDQQILEEIVRSNFSQNYEALPESVRSIYPKNEVEKKAFPYLAKVEEAKPVKKPKAPRMPRPKKINN